MSKTDKSQKPEASQSTEMTKNLNLTPEPLAPSSPPKSGGPKPRTQANKGLGPDVQMHIGECLREAYGELVKEPIPPHLVKLLNDLAEKDKDS
jgi:hypothetical protein